MGSVPMARSSLNRLSALRRKYPNMMDAAYICAHCSLDMRTSVLEYAFWVCGPSMPMRCSLTISSASTEWTREERLFARRFSLALRGLPRDVLGLALAAADEAPVEETRFGVFRM